MYRLYRVRGLKCFVEVFCCRGLRWENRLLTAQNIESYGKLSRRLRAASRQHVTSPSISKPHTCLIALQLSLDRDASYIVVFKPLWGWLTTVKGNSACPFERFPVRRREPVHLSPVARLDKAVARCRQTQNI